MSSGDPALRRYRIFLTVFVLLAGAIAGGAGLYLLWKGSVFKALLALVAVGFFVLLAHGYRQDAEERERS